MKHRIRLTESDLHRIVRESVKRVLKESIGVSKLANFIANAVKDAIQTDNSTVWYIELGRGLSCVIAWQPGWGEELRDDVIQSKSEPDYGLCMGIKMTGYGFDAADWTMLYNKNGDIITEDHGLEPDFDPYKEAESILEEFESLKDYEWDENGLIYDHK